MKTTRKVAVILRALELESPALGELNREIVAAGGEPIPARSPWLEHAAAEIGLESPAIVTGERTDEVKITAYKSDISGELIADEKQLARIRVSYPNDKRRSARLVDATAAEADELLGDAGKPTGTPGRKPSSSTAPPPPA